MALHQQVRGIHIGTSRWDLRLFLLVSFVLLAAAPDDIIPKHATGAWFVPFLRNRDGVGTRDIRSFSLSGLIDWWCKAWFHLVARQCFES